MRPAPVSWARRAARSGGSRRRERASRSWFSTTACRGTPTRRPCGSSRSPSPSAEPAPRRLSADEDRGVDRADLGLDLERAPCVVDPEELVESDADLAAERHSADRELDQPSMLVEES